VKTNGGDVIPAGMFITVRSDTGADKIIRSDRSRVNILSADITGNHADVFSRAKKLLDRAVAGGDCEAKLLGEYEDIRRSGPELNIRNAASPCFSSTWCSHHSSNRSQAP
jgi:hypothetical protein